MQDLASREMPTTGDSREAGEKFCGRLFQQLQGRGELFSPVRPDGVDFGHVHWAFEGCGPVCPCSERKSGGVLQGKINETDV